MSSIQNSEEKKANEQPVISKLARFNSLRDDIEKLNKKIEEKEEKARQSPLESGRISREIIALRTRISDLKTMKALEKSNIISKKFHKSFACVKNHWMSKERTVKNTTNSPVVSE